MNIQEYISSGILESYALGMLSDVERQEVEQVISQNPEIKLELLAIEEAMESYAQMQAMTPPADVEGKILAKIASATTTTVAEAPKLDTSPSRLPARILLFAALLGLVGMFYFYTQQSKYQQQLEANNKAFAELQASYDNLDKTCEQFNRQVAYLRDPANRPILMSGTSLAPSASAVVHWNPTAKKSFLDALSLPDPSPNKQYQLWAIVDGKPTDMGVFDLKAADDFHLIEIPFIANAQAFAVTLEDFGGNPTPNLDQLYIIGNV